jgi:hypothetical protein
MREIVVSLKHSTGAAILCAVAAALLSGKALSRVCIPIERSDGFELSVERNLYAKFECHFARHHPLST